jgi:hypothetical protein
VERDGAGDEGLGAPGVGRAAPPAREGERERELGAIDVSELTICRTLQCTRE